MAYSTSFETDLSGWSTIGDVSRSLPTVTEGNVGATDGSYVAKLIAQGASQAQIESFLGLTAGTLDANNGDVIDGSAFKTTVSLQAGDTFQFDWYFDATDYLPFNDYSFFTSVTGPLVELSDVQKVGDFQNSGWPDLYFHCSK